MKPTWLVAAVVAAVAVAAAVATSRGNAQGGGVRTITLIEREGSFHFVDNPPRQGVNVAPLAGDEFVGSTPLFTRAGRRAGTLDFHCVLVTGGERGRTHCTGTYSLAGGAIAAQAVFRGFESPPTIAITGGTGAYEGARGSISSRDRRNVTISVIRLLP
jgi:hypothetical protein